MGLTLTELDRQKNLQTPSGNMVFVRPAVPGHLITSNEFKQMVREVLVGGKIYILKNYTYAANLPHQPIVKIRRGPAGDLVITHSGSLTGNIIASLVGHSDFVFCTDYALGEK